MAVAAGKYQQLTSSLTFAQPDVRHGISKSDIPFLLQLSLVSKSRGLTKVALS